MATADTTIATWNRDRGRENAMGPLHGPIWRRLIALADEGDLSAKTVLDFGCNQGGFLRMLHALRPFRYGLGVDIATESVARAESMKGDLPVDYRAAGELASQGTTFDVAFSHEVIYLVADVAAHARQILSALRPGGVYYAATACHTGNRLWPIWRRLIAESSALDFPDRSLDDYARAFHAAGFEVGVRPFGVDEFAPYGPDARFYPTIEDRIYAMGEAKMLFRLVRPH